MPRKETDSELNKKVAEKLRRLRREQELSQQNVADDNGISSTAYSKMEAGRIDFTITRLAQLASYFRVALPDFFDDSLVIPRPETTAILAKDYETKLHEAVTTKEALMEMVKDLSQAYRGR